MNKIVAMHQPNYLPWIGLFSKISQADCFVIADTMPFTKHSVTPRNKIRTNCGWHYLTIPISPTFQMARICDVTLPPDGSWQQAHWQLIKDSYGRAEFFAPHREFFERLYETHFTYLWEINEQIMLYLLRCFDVNVEVMKASEMNVDPSLQKTDLMIALLKKAGADVYLSGPSGTTYLEEEKFAENNVGLKFFRFEHPEYKQRFSGFEPNMSAIDLLFNMGPGAAETIRTCGSVEDNCEMQPSALRD